MAKTRKTVAFTGGGTAGHVFPAFPVVERIRNAGFTPVWIGSNRGLERRLVEEAGIRFIGIPAGKLRRYRSLHNFVDIFRIVAGFWKSIRILCRERPIVLFSKGGFVTVPPVAAAFFVRIPSFTHESDVDPGLATRLNLRFGAIPLVAYPRTLDYLPNSARHRALVVGNPVRDAIFQGDSAEGRRLAGLSRGTRKPLILVLGGSQGAREINDMVYGCLDDLLTAAAVVHQTGPGNPSSPDRPGYMGRPFFGDEMPHLLAAADLAITRSGAGTIWELAASGTPGILIPLREATRGDQLRNAAVAQETGMAITLGRSAGAADILDLVRGILGDERRLESMAAAAAAFPVREAADRIYRAIRERIA